MNRAIIVHGWEGYPKEGWFPYVKHELQARGWNVNVPAMPNSEHPKMNEWVPHLAQAISTPDRQTYLVGHSLGCITILRYLESLPEGAQIGGAVLVAGFGTRLKYDELTSFFITPLNWPLVRTHCPKFTALFSDNDRYVSLANAELFKTELGAAVEVLHKRGHFSGPSDKCFELPEALAALLRLSQV